MGREREREKKEKKERKKERKNERKKKLCLTFIKLVMKILLGPADLIQIGANIAAGSKSRGRRGDARPTVQQFLSSPARLK